MTIRQVLTDDFELCINNKYIITIECNEIEFHNRTFEEMTVANAYMNMLRMTVPFIIKSEKLSHEDVDEIDFYFGCLLHNNDGLVKFTSINLIDCSLNDIDDKDNINQYTGKLTSVFTISHFHLEFNDSEQARNAKDMINKYIKEKDKFPTKSELDLIEVITRK